MDFYTYSAIQQSVHTNLLLQYGLIFLLLIGFIIIGIRFLKDRHKSKYRNIAIIILLSILFLTGIQINDYRHDIDEDRSSSTLMSFMNSVSKMKNVHVQDVVVNTKRAYSGMIVGIKGRYYEVDFNNNFTGYELHDILLINNDIRYIDANKDKR